MTISVRLHGSLTSELYDAVTTAWSRCLTPRPDQPSLTLDVLLDDDPERVAAARRDSVLASTSLPELMDSLSPAVTVQAITEQAGRMVMLHACGIADRASGRTLALVGPSGRGKTTAVRTLAADPALAYVTDETVGVREDGSVATYAKPLSVIDPTRPHKQQLSADAFGLGTPPTECRLTGLLLLQRSPDGPATPELEPVSMLLSLAALAPETSYLGLLPQPLHRLAAVAESVGGVYALRYREASDLLPVVAGLMRR